MTWRCVNLLHMTHYLSIFFQSTELLLLISGENNTINSLVCVTVHYNGEARCCRLWS